MSKFQNLDSLWDERIEQAVLKKNGFSIACETVIAFRSMLEDGKNSIEDLKDMLAFVKCFHIYQFRTNDIGLILSDTENQWFSSYEYDEFIQWDLKNFYQIEKHIYYIHW